MTYFIRSALEWVILVMSCSICNVSPSGNLWNSLNFPEEHLPYMLSKDKALGKKCAEDPDCPYKHYMEQKRCWGYEKNCLVAERMLSPTCTVRHDVLPAWIKRYPGAETEEDIFWMQSDFGFVKERLSSMKTLCTAHEPGDSSLKCTKYTQLCLSNNIYMDLSGLDVSSRDRYREDLFTEGQLGGHCSLKESQLRAMGEHKSPLQSWFAELQHYNSLDFKPNQKTCDIVINKPTILMKLDAGINMYHHFCDFFNLYLSQHVWGNFSTDIQLINWDTSGLSYGDFFHATWAAFSDHPVKYLKDYAGKKVCIKKAMFPFLPRMRYGLFYNTPIIDGCTDSAAFRAFSQHILHRLGVVQDGPLRDKVRVTLLSRSTKYRKILNQDEIVKALEAVGHYEVLVVDYTASYPFLNQLQVTHNSDIFMGMHGSGLTHMLFQPDWGAGFEIYNCDDVHCYKDLARLRGVKYFTWEDSDLLHQEDEGHHPTLGAHKKFTNYSFNVEEFLRIVAKMAAHVRGHVAFQEAWRRKYGATTGSSDTGAATRVEL